jgi:hypothetical protein
LLFSDFLRLRRKSYWLKTRLFTFNRPLSDISINGNYGYSN